MNRLNNLTLLCCLLLSVACEKEVVIPLSNGRSITKCITHRGYVDVTNPQSIENSLGAFDEAYRRGADGTELDIQHTKDGVAILGHDAEYLKVGKSKSGKQCPLTTKVKDLTAAEILDNCELKNGEEIPTFEQALAHLSGRNFVLLLDFKSTPNDKTIALIKKYYQGKFEKIITLVTFAINLSEVYTLKSKMPNPMYLSGDVFQSGSENGFDGIEVRKISDINISYLQQKGKHISVFDINQASEMKHFMGKNVDYITTDNLEACLGVR